MLELAIGLVMIYLLLSLICSSIREGIEAWQKTRAADLERGVRALLQDPGGTGLAKSLYEHPLIYGLFNGTYDPTKSHKNLPSYIPAANFAVALMDTIARGPCAPGAAAAPAPPPGGATAAATPPRLSVEALRIAAGKLQNGAVQRALLAALDTAQGDLGRVQANLQAWFDSTMDRVSGWYKRRTQAIIFVIGLVVTVVVNADTLTIAQQLVQDDSLRKALVAEAEGTVRNGQPRPDDAQARYRELEAKGFPIGWTRTLPAWSDACDLGCIAYSVVRQVPGHVAGWLITAFAISLGAPFWFDLLNKFIVIRSTVKPHEKSPEEASEDRQAPVRQLANGGGAAPRHEWARGNPQEGVL
jgi:hypothetical protein